MNKPSRLTRVYGSGKRVTIYAKDPEHIKDWREFNEMWRFGNAQFINGECVYNGCNYLSNKELEEIALDEKRIISESESFGS